MTTAEIIEVIKGLTVLELNDLVKACEEEFGVSAAAGVVVAAAGAEGGRPQQPGGADLQAGGADDGGAARHPGLKIGGPDMSSTVILAAAAAFALGCVFCLGLWWLSTHRSKRGRTETMKATVWLCLCNGCAWVWCSYLLAYLGREQIAEQLSGKAVTEIIAVILAYAIKSILENLSKHNNWPDRSGKKEETTHE